MRKLLIVGLALSAVIVAATTSQPAAADTEGCYMVTSTADARNPQIASDRANRHLQSYIGRRLNKLTGKTVSPITTQCIRNACKAQATICPA
jgi:hypothetical protein